MRNGMPATSLLAFGLGGESGRAILEELHPGILAIGEIHRFPNQPLAYGGASTGTFRTCGGRSGAMLAMGAVSPLKDVRAMAERSFPVEIFEPQNCSRWEQEAERLQQYSKTTDARS